MKKKFIINSVTLYVYEYRYFQLAYLKVRLRENKEFFFYFSSILDYLLPNTRNSIEHNTWSEMER